MLMLQDEGKGLEVLGAEGHDIRRVGKREKEAGRGQAARPALPHQYSQVD